MARSVMATTFAGVLLSSASLQAAVVNQWVQFAPNDMAYVRAIESVPANGCPVATLDGQPLTLTQRGTVTTTAQAPQTHFQVLMCEALVPAFGHSGATVGTVALKMPVANPKRILVIGDTGCRVTAATSGTQNCNDPAQFPLQFVSNYAASFNPDLIVHVGDFFYREQPCPTGFTGCAGNPVFDNWDAWYADWFGPAANLMAAAPMAISRGNHESCNRGAHGWFRMLDVHAYDQGAVDCTGPYTPQVGAPGTKGALTQYDYTDPYVVKAGQVSLVMFDSSDSSTGSVDNTTTSSATATKYPSMTIPAIYSAQLNAVLGTIPAGSNVVYVTHKAAYDIRQAKTAQGYLMGGDFTQQSVFNGVSSALLAPIKLLVSGHDHQYQAVTFAGGVLPPMMVVGNSGTLLDNQTGTQPQAFTPDTTGKNAGATYALPGVSSTATVTLTATSDRSEYGFTVMDANSTGYLINVYNTSSNKQGRCGLTLATRSLLCAQ